MMKKFKDLTERQYLDIEHEVYMMLHMSRDAMRNRGHDTTKITFDVTDAYYGEAFGIMRALQVLGYGEFGSDNIPNSIRDHWNLKWWFAQICQAVLEVEHFGREHAGKRFANHCDFCFERYGKDGARSNARPQAPTI